VPHRVANRGDEDAKLLLIMSPADHDRHFDELAELLAGAGPVDPAAIADVRRRYDTQPVSLGVGEQR
jgi:hypothetical protein